MAYDVKANSSILLSGRDRAPADGDWSAALAWGGLPPRTSAAQARPLFPRDGAPPATPLPLEGQGKSA